MNRVAFFIAFCLAQLGLAQNVQVDSQSYSPQELIEDILIDSNCIENVVVTNVLGGDFNGTDQSYGYFNAGGSDFPFEEGIILATGRLENAQGPNTSLSDDDAPNWLGDEDIETILDEPNTFNATILEFEFTSVASQISFRYIFASEEYQENNPNTCQFSDLFGFLIRPQNELQYTNIALVPNTQIPVKVTTVHPEIPNGCPAENEFYFGSWNDVTAPINYDGQTKILTATADVIPNETYHVKLVIADEQNFRYDSAVFLEAGSFQLSTELGEDRLLATNNPLCENETIDLDAFHNGNTSYKWFKDANELIGETSSIYTVSEAGTYSVEVTLEGNCISYGEIIIEYGTNPLAFNAVLIACDFDMDGFTFYNLNDATNAITDGDTSLMVSGFYPTMTDAIQLTNIISEQSNFENTSLNQTVFARVINQDNCFVIVELLLQISNTILIMDPFTSCDTEDVDGFTNFDLSVLRDNITLISPPNASIEFYESIGDALAENNPLPDDFENTIENSQIIFVKIESNGQCYALSEVELAILFTPSMAPDITVDEPIYYCLNTFPETITLTSGLLDDMPENFNYLWSTNETTSDIEINAPGTYTVVVTSSNGCTGTRTIEVVASNTATIEEVVVEDLASNNTITIIASGQGVYEYALDDISGPYQMSPVFTNVSAGIHTVFVRDSIGCGIVEQLVSVLGFPLFFTPNGDGYNDRWHIKGNHDETSLDISIQIFNRYGKLIKSINSATAGWNGTVNGYDLPSDDYWFLARFSDGKVFRGHFALVR